MHKLHAPKESVYLDNLEWAMHVFAMHVHRHITELIPRELSSMILLTNILYLHIVFGLQDFWHFSFSLQAF